MSVSDPDYLTLAQVAATTGRHPELLRQWCAAGRLPCRRVGGSWVLRASEIELVERMERRGRTRARPRLRTAARPGSRVVAAAFTDPLAGEQAATELRAALPEDGADVGSVSLELPGTGEPPLSMTVVAARLPIELVREARARLVSQGGRIVADVGSESAAPDDPEDRYATAPNTSAAFSPPKPKEVERIRR
jgi:hypothetical protein